ncbi:membrane protein [Ectopseudomonas oleovorans]|nr:membrane protein [Pseudomonas oleovorans]
MQWIFMLVGLVLGVGVSESVTGALLGGLIGLSLGQALRLQGLETRNAQLAAQLKDFAERFDHGTRAIHERLVKVEQGERSEPESVPASADPVASSAPEAQPEPVVAEEPELDWTLDPLPEIETSQPVAEPAPLAVQVAHQPQPAAQQSPWREQAPREPNLIERGIAAAKAWLFGGNTVLRVGVVLLFLGLAFLLRYATEGVEVPVELRYMGVAASALALLGLGWWLRRRNPGYALVLQGTGIAVLYLTVFAAMRLHPLLDPGMALGLLVAVTLFSAILAVQQNALGLAAAAALGGFAAPILTSTGSGNHVALFSYFALLNAGIFAIAWFKAWRLLNLIGFVGTFGIGFAWGLRSYTPELLGSTQPFLILFFLMYVAIGLLFARRTLRDAADAPEARDELLRWSLRRGDYVDATTLFGPPLIGFGLQVALVRHIEFAAAFSALGLGLFYLLLARVLKARAGDRTLLLMETCLALGVVFASLAIPLGLDARWTAAAWAVEGAGIFWLGLRQGRPLARAFALLLQVGAALAFISGLEHGYGSLLDGSPLGALMLGAALLFSYWQLRQAPQAANAWENRLLPWLGLAGLAFVYLIAPLLFEAPGTAIAWALAGLATLFVGLRIAAPSFVYSAFAIQLLGGLLFLGQMALDSLFGRGGFSTGWFGLLAASMVGLGLIAGMLLAARDPQIRENRRLLGALSMVMLVGLVFINLAVLFVLPWVAAAAVWGGTGLLILWLALYLQQRAAFMFSLALQVFAGLAFLAAGPLLLSGISGEGLSPLAHTGFWTPAVLGLAAQIGAWRLQGLARSGRDTGIDGVSLQRLGQLLLAWGAAWWALALASEVLRFVAPNLQASALLVLAASSALLWMLLALRTRWRELAVLCSLLAPVAGLVLIHAWHPFYHPAANFGWMGWAAVIAVHLLILRSLGDLLPSRAASVAHVFGCWLLLGVLALELRYLLLSLSDHYNAWRWLGWALLPTAFLWVMAQARRLPWPVAGFEREYRLWAAAPLAALMLAWFWLANANSAGDSDPLPYLPLFNPLELGLLLCLGALFVWARDALPRFGLAPVRVLPVVQGVAGVSLFALLTVIVMRTAHHWGGVPWQTSALFDSMLVQTGLSIVWTLIALTLMLFGHLRVRRELWLVGAALIALVVAKLFFVELGNRGGLERIVSFIGVGVLLLVVGYFAPLPPRKAEKSAAEEQESAV